MVTIRLRPHHLTIIEEHIYEADDVIARGLRNCRYSDAYIENERSLTWKILTERDCSVEIVPALDDLCICKPKKKRCFENDPEDHMAYMKTLGLELGHTYTARDIVKRIQDKREREDMFREAQRL